MSEPIVMHSTNAPTRDAIDAIRSRLVERIAQATSDAISELAQLGVAGDAHGVIEAGIEAMICATRRHLAEIPETA